MTLYGGEVQVMAAEEKNTIKYTFIFVEAGRVPKNNH